MKRRDFVVFPVSRHFPYSRGFVVSPVSRHFCAHIGKNDCQGAPNDLECGRGVTEYGKCLETGKQQNPL